MKKSLLVLLVAIAMSPWSGCRFLWAEETQTKTLAVVEVPPFVYEDGTGLDIDLFNSIAKDNGWEASIKYYPTIKEVLQAVKDGEADFGMSGITINSSREMNGIDFSQPYFLDGGIQIMTHNDNARLSFSEKAKIAAPTIKRMLLMLFIIVTILAHFVWLREAFNGDDSNFHHNYFIGIFEAYYWAIVTSSTVGYGDITAKTVIGRILTIFAIIVGLTWFADFMSDMSAVKAIIVNQKANMELADLNGEKVATLANTTSHEMLKRCPGIEIVPFTNAQKACEAVANKEVHSVIYDAPVLRYFADNNDSVCLAGDFIVKEQYGIAAKEGNPDVENLTQSILKFKEDGRYDKIKGDWFKQ